MFDDNKLTLDESLSHFGVRGMKWGVRQRVSGSNIRAARKSVRKDARAQLKEQAKFVVGKSSRASVREKKLTYLTNPDRSTAARLTRGETIAMALLATPATALAVAGGSQIQSRLITSRQSEGYLRPDGSGKLKRQIITA